MNARTDSLGTSRNLYLDALKGTAIVLVVLGHSIQRNLPDYASNSAFLLIYSFHMPMFAALSGYVIEARVRRPVIRWLGNKAAGLLIPLAAWYAVFYFASALPVTGLGPFIQTGGGFAHYLWIGVYVPRNGLWFFWVLFLCYLTLVVFRPFSRWLHSWYLAVAVAAAVVGLPLVLFKIGVNPNYFGLAEYLRLFPFFALGCLVSRKRTQLRPLLVAVGPLCIVLFPVVGLAWGGVHWPFVGDVLPTPTETMQTILGGLAAAIGIVACATVVRVIRSLRAWAAPYRLLSALGYLSLDIYVLSLLFGRAGVGAGWTKVLSATVVAISASLALSYLIRRSALASAVLLGRRGASRKMWPTMFVASEVRESAKAAVLQPDPPCN